MKYTHIFTWDSRHAFETMIEDLKAHTLTCAKCRIQDAKPYHPFDASKPGKPGAATLGCDWANKQLKKFQRKFM